MQVTVRSFAKINIGLRIGQSRDDRFHELRTIYQTIALHDILRIEVIKGQGIEIRCEDARVPLDSSNTCYKVIELAVSALKTRGRVVLEIEKRLPVQGGMGGASSNAVAALLALERALKKQIPASDKLRIAAEVGSDLPLFLIGGTVLGVGRGEEVYPAPDLPSLPCVIVTPDIAVSTPKAFADWDSSHEITAEQYPETDIPQLTPRRPSDRMNEFSRAISAWLSSLSGVPVIKGRGRAETPLLDLVRTGIENDFEQVVFPQYPELREVKSVLKKSGADYASLSGSGSATYGLFSSRAAAVKAASRLRKAGIPAVATTTLTRPQYWKKLF
ncbi:MAG: 4-diphosphocytidyl-2-C-methyl-D-erythritol kinase [Acidobacteriaceae bacterium]|jgi:4-diphosphocytidyl-2-C-methyl-D-erythritol kinase